MNLENNAHFIVEYDDELFKDILENTEELDDISELQLMQDLYLLAEGQKLTIRNLCRCFRYLRTANPAWSTNTCIRLQTVLRSSSKPIRKKKRTAPLF